ncbi:hypothetical protein [Nostoc flagelliforme]|uniref:hypothetical protein n=1 Tax=Nostoc flagelliforme TaxID=1306274 RepID=UPI0018EFDEF5|nr:hypothetical protein [Nostoc flagelliforme]
MSFYRKSTDGSGDACLYFILDSKVELVLYVGKTCRSNKRWKGIHDCKDYIASYQNLHSRYGLQTAVNAAFWWDTPVDQRARKGLELKLIFKYCSVSPDYGSPESVKFDLLAVLGIMPERSPVLSLAYS